MFAGKPGEVYERQMHDPMYVLVGHGKDMFDRLKRVRLNTLWQGTLYIVDDKGVPDFWSQRITYLQ